MFKLATFDEFANKCALLFDFKCNEWNRPLIGLFLSRFTKVVRNTQFERKKAVHTEAKKFNICIKYT